MTNLFGDVAMRGLAAALTLHQQRHEVLASNLANVETPGFRARDLDFRAALQEAFDETVAAEVPDGTTMAATVVEDTRAPAKIDGNSVDLDLQMVQLTANSGRYNTLARILGKRLSLLRAAIEGSR